MSGGWTPDGQTTSCGTAIRNSDGAIVAVAKHVPSSDLTGSLCERHAHLIAAAPCMAKVLADLEKWFDTDEEILAAMPEAERADNARQLAKIRAALAKAGAA